MAGTGSEEADEGGVERVVGVPEPIDNIGALVEGFDRATSVPSRKCTSELSVGHDDSL